MKPTLFVLACGIALLAGCHRRTTDKSAVPANQGITQAGPTQEQSTWLAKAKRHEREGWTYLHIEGTARERGFQHGFMLAPEIKESLRVTRAVWEYESGMDWAWLVEKAAPMFKSKIDRELLDELSGTVEGLSAAGYATNLDEMITYNGYVELSGYWWPEQKAQLEVRSPDVERQSCSSFIATGHMTRDGGIVLGHNTMCSYVEADCSVILDVVPEKGHRILMQTSPGWIHSGTDFFITSSGLVGSETTIGSFHGFDDRGTPEFVRMRRATQDAGTIDQWCEIMKSGNNGGYANAWLIGDIHTNEIARLELGLKTVGFERTKDGFYTGSNVAENRKILRLETDQHETNIRASSVSRRVRWMQLMREYEGKITAERAEAFEGDHYDSYLHQNQLSWRALCAHGDCDSLDLSLPFEPGGTVDAKVVDSQMAGRMTFVARWGAGCGRPFDAKAFLEAHPQFGWQQGLLKSRRSYAWTLFSADEP